MIKKWRSGWLFPLILAICLGGLSAWLGRISELDIEEVALNPNEPQYAMVDIDGRRFDETGRLKANLERQELTFNRAKREVEQLQDKESDNNPKMLKSKRAGEVEKVRSYCLKDVEITKKLFDTAMQKGVLKYKELGKTREVKIDTKQWLVPAGNAMTFTLGL